MEEKKKILTYAGLKALEDELENLKVVKRKEVAAKIKEAREQRRRSLTIRFLPFPTIRTNLP